jgi:D-amino acid aminotransferase
MGSIGIVDGRIIDLGEKIIEMEDRGYQFGDGVYEVTRIYNGRPFALKLHMDRLYRSLRELKIPAVYTFEELASFHERLIKESGLTDASIYLQISRGFSPRAHAFPDNVVPRLTMSIRSAKANTELQASGAKGTFVPDERWLRCDIKSVNLLGNLLAKQRAKAVGAFEAVQIRDGVVTEGSSSNFFIVKDGVLWTHPVSNLILRGITRTIIIDRLAPNLGLTVIEKQFDQSFALAAEEAFVCGTNTEIMPLILLDSHQVGDGKPGAVTGQLVSAYNAFIIEECGGK